MFNLFIIFTLLVLSVFKIHAEVELLQQIPVNSKQDSTEGQEVKHSIGMNLPNNKTGTNNWWRQLYKCAGTCTDFEQFQQCLSCIEQSIESSASLRNILDGFLLVIGAVVIRAQYLCFRNCRKSRRLSNSQQDPKVSPCKNQLSQQTSNVSTTNNYTYYVQNHYYYCVSQDGESKQLTPQQYAQLVPPSCNNNDKLLIEEPQ